MKTVRILQIVATISCLSMAIVCYFTKDIQRAIWFLLVGLTNYILWRGRNEK